jgi:hypothetical protein
MKTPFLLIATSLLTSACSYDKLIAEGNCAPDVKGPKNVTLSYSPDGYTLESRTKVRKKSLFVIKLKPSKELRSTVITIDGVNGTLPGGGNTEANWLDKSASWNEQKKFVLCVPETPEGTEYKYTVNIPELVFIDPRLEVTK